MAHAAALLAPGGRLVLVEGTAPLARLDIAFGGTEGWWAFADTDLRPGHPLLGTDGWRALLHEADLPAGAATMTTAVTTTVEVVSGKVSGPIRVTLSRGGTVEGRVIDDVQRVAIAGALRSLKDRDLEESASTRLLVYAALLIKDGMDPVAAYNQYGKF